MTAPTPGLTSRVATRPRPVRVSLRARAALATLLALGARRADALDPRKAATQYVHDVWTTDRGLPQNGVAAAVRTADGYLWLATEEGLTRFDGLRFTVKETCTVGGAGGVTPTALLAAGNALWVGTRRHGVCEVSGGAVVSISAADGLPQGGTTALAEDGAGGVWIGTSPYGGLTLVKDGRLRTFTMRDGLSSDSVLSLARDRRGRLWIGTSAGLDLRDGDRFVHLGAREGLAPGAVFAILEDRAGTLWVGTKEGDPGSPGDRGALSALRDGRFTSFPTGTDDSPGVRTLLEDRDGNLWCGTSGGGLRRFSAGALRETALLPSSSVLSLLEDPEGSLWIGTDAAGLHRLRDGPFTTFGREEGLEDEVVESLFEDHARALWIGTRWRGAFRLQRGALTRFSTREALPNDRVNAIAEDASGTVWLGTAAGLVRLGAGRPETLSTEAGTSADNVSALHAAPDGTLWIGTLDGLFALSRGRFTRLGRKEGLAGEAVTCIAPSRGGGLWIGTTGGVSRLAGGTLADMTSTAGFPVDVLSLHEDGEGVLWIGTRGDGLYRFRGGRLAHFTRRDGLPQDVISTIGEDGAGQLWIGGNKGVFRVPRSQLAALADGAVSPLRCTVYGTADGLRSSECAGGQGQLRAHDGRIWFATVRGASVLDPGALTANRVEPPVVIESASAGGAPFDPATVPRVPGGRATLSVRYVGLSYRVPERVRYRYRLEGLSDAWFDAGDQREANFANLPPGRYTFRVSAANDAGLFNARGAALSIEVLPRFWQTWWFRALAAAAVLALMGLAHGRRVAALEREKAEQDRLSRLFNEAQEAERKRIAAELHDSLGQSLVIIKNRARKAADALGDAAATREQLEEITESASEALAEVRQIAYDLRPFHVDRLGLTRAVEALVRKVADSTDVEVTSQLADAGGLLAPGDEIGVYRIVQEALGNAVKHAQARHIHVALAREDGALRLTIQDDGRGFAPRAAAPAPGAGGFGLVGMAERAKLLRATLEIRSTPGTGTTIALDVPAR